jgi:methanogenic corrinoid protein MtbC1
MAYHLLQSGIRVTPLGASLPLVDLQKVIEQRCPDFVMLSVTRKEVLAAHREALKQLVQRFSGGVPRFVLGGAAVSDDAELSASGILLWPPSRPLVQLAEELGLG